jgi:ferrous iron transport protein A
MSPMPGTRTQSLSRKAHAATFGPQAGQKGAIVQVCGAPDFRLRMMEMGFIKGTEIQVVKYAPLSDPIEFVIKGYHVTLRREQAADILMEGPEKAA